MYLYLGVICTLQKPERGNKRPPGSGLEKQEDENKRTKQTPLSPKNLFQVPQRYKRSSSVSGLSCGFDSGFGRLKVKGHDRRTSGCQLVLAGDGHRQLFPRDGFPQMVELLADQDVTDIAPVAIDVDDVRLVHLVSPTLSPDAIVVKNVGLLHHFEPRVRLCFLHVAQLVAAPRHLGFSACQMSEVRIGVYLD